MTDSPIKLKMGGTGTVTPPEEAPVVASTQEVTTPEE